jgi:hypothetical protein
MNALGVSSIDHDPEFGVSDTGRWSRDESDASQIHRWWRAIWRQAAADVSSGSKEIRLDRAG